MLQSLLPVRRQHSAKARRSKMKYLIISIDEDYLEKFCFEEFLAKCSGWPRRSQDLQLQRQTHFYRMTMNYVEKSNNKGCLGKIEAILGSRQSHTMPRTSTKTCMEPAWGFFFSRVYEAFASNVREQAKHNVNLTSEQSWHGAHGPRARLLIADLSQKLELLKNI